MKKKIIALALIFAMLVPLSPVVAADESTSQPTIEEILNAYHEKAFAAQSSEDTGSASTWSRHSGTEKTLEEETVDELTAAGYEAYNVTSDNYEPLEETLKTDFSRLGMDPDSSYIIVISGEDGATTNSSRAIDTTLPPHIGSDETGDDGSFPYSYKGVTYSMRYVTITHADVDNVGLYKTETKILSDIDHWDTIQNSVSEFAMSYATEKVVEKVLSSSGDILVDCVPYAGLICDLISLFVDIAGAVTQSPLQDINPDAWILRATTIRVCSYIEIYDTSAGEWYAVQRSTYANLTSKIIPPDVYDPETNWTVLMGNIVKEETVYSIYYADASTRKLQAVLAHLGGYIYSDDIGDIEYYFKNPEDPNSVPILIFTH